MTFSPRATRIDSNESSQPMKKFLHLAAAAALLTASAAQAAPETTASGLVFETITQGSGPSPRASDMVQVHYRGWLPGSDKDFDSSIARGKPAVFGLDMVIPCWTEAVQKMKVGGKARLTCPPAIAYGSRGAGGVIPPNATLNFEVELLGIGKP